MDSRSVIGDIETKLHLLLIRIDELEEALKPFAMYAGILNDNRHPNEMRIGYYSEPSPTVGDCRKAAKLLFQDKLQEIAKQGVTTTTK